MTTRRYYKLMLDALQSGDSPLSVDDLTSCARQQELARNSVIAARACNSMFCNLCRTARMSRRVRAYANRFSRLPAGSVGAVTLLFQPHASLLLPTGLHTYSDRDRVSLAEGTPAAKIELQKMKTVLGRLLLDNFDSCLLVGSIEFELADRMDCGLNKRAFIDSFSHPGFQPWNDHGRTWISHAHITMCASGPDGPHDRRRIADVLRTRFTKPYQVRVDPISGTDHRGRIISSQHAIARWMRYSMKWFTDLPADQLRELARFDARVHKRFYTLSREFGHLPEVEAAPSADRRPTRSPLLLGPVSL